VNLVVKPSVRVREQILIRDKMDQNHALR